MNNRLRFLTAALICTAYISGAAFAAQDADVKALLQSAPSSSDYPNAGYINLIDEAWYTIRDDGSWTSRTRTTQKILNDRGRSAADVQIGYNSAFEKIKILRARTIKKDGTVIDIKPADIQEVTPYSGYAMYSSVKAKVLIMPAIEDDCIIDYEWEVTGKKTIMAPHFWNGWYYQSSEPSVLSRFTLQTPADKGFGSQPYNTEIKPVVTTSKDGKTKTYVWEGRNFPEVEYEPYMPPRGEFLPWFEISSVTSWDDVAAWYWKLIEPQMKSSPEIDQQVADLIKGKQTDEERAKAIYYWVEDNIRYVGLEFGASAYEPHSARDVFANKYGDCKDQASLLVTMLEKAGIKAYPVLLSVGYRGDLNRRLPSPGQFDHCIALAEIGSAQYWLDSTAEVCRFGDLPEQDRGRDVLVIKDGKGEFVATTGYDAKSNNVVQTVKIDLDAQGGISSSVQWTTIGGADLSTRAMYKYLKPSKVKESFEGVVSSIAPDAKLGPFSVSDHSDREKNMTVAYEFTAGKWANRTGKFLMFNPQLNQNPAAKTPFSKSDRKLDMWFSGASSNNSETVVNLPYGFTVEELPPDVSLKSDFAVYERKCALDGRTLKINENVIRQDAVVPISRYAEVRKFFEDIIQAQNQQVILRATE